jgi:hypothetical protein
MTGFTAAGLSTALQVYCIWTCLLGSRADVSHDAGSGHKDAANMEATFSKVLRCHPALVLTSCASQPNITASTGWLANCCDNTIPISMHGNLCLAWWMHHDCAQCTPLRAGVLFCLACQRCSNILNSRASVAHMQHRVFQQYMYLCQAPPVAKGSMLLWNPSTNTGVASNSFAYFGHRIRCIAASSSGRDMAATCYRCSMPAGARQDSRGLCWMLDPR